MNLSQFKDLAERHDRGIPILITNPETGEPTDITITVAGPWSNISRQAAKDLGASNPELVGTPELLNQKVMARRVLSWENIEVGPKKLACTPENAERLFTDPAYYWLYIQVVSKADQARLFQRA